MSRPNQPGQLDLTPVWSALGEIDFMARAMIEYDDMDASSAAGPTLRRACFVRMLDVVQLATLTLEGLDVTETIKLLRGVTV